MLELGLLHPLEALRLGTCAPSVSQNSFPFNVFTLTAAISSQPRSSPRTELERVEAVVTREGAVEVGSSGPALQRDMTGHNERASMWRYRLAQQM